MIFLVCWIFVLGGECEQNIKGVLSNDEHLLKLLKTKRRLNILKNNENKKKTSEWTVYRKNEPN